jgi:hypothetical protein
LRTGTALITKVDYANKAINSTVAGVANAPTSAADNDYLFLGDTNVNGSGSREMMGLEGIIDDGTNVATFQGLTRSTYPELNGQIIDSTAAAWDATLSEEIFDYADSLRVRARQHGSAERVLVNRSGQRSFWKNLKNDRTINDPRGTFQGGTNRARLKMQLGDRIVTLAAARKVPASRAYGIDASASSASVSATAAGTTPMVRCGTASSTARAARTPSSPCTWRRRSSAPATRPAASRSRVSPRPDRRATPRRPGRTSALGAVVRVTRLSRGVAVHARYPRSKRRPNSQIARSICSSCRSRPRSTSRRRTRTGRKSVSERVMQTLLPNFPHLRLAPPHVLAGLREVDPTADLVYLGWRRWMLVSVRQDLMDSWYKQRNGQFSTLRRHALGMLVNARRLLELWETNPKYRANPGAYRRLINRHDMALLAYQGARPITDYTVQGEPTAAIVDDFKRRDWLYRNTTDDELLAQVNAPKEQQQAEARAQFSDIHRAADAWRYCFTLNHWVGDPGPQQRTRSGFTTIRTIS